MFWVCPQLLAARIGATIFFTEKRKQGIYASFFAGMVGAGYWFVSITC